MKLTLTCKCGSLDFDYKGNNKFVCNECGATESVYGGEIGLQRQFAPEIEVIPYMSDIDITKLMDTLYTLSMSMDTVYKMWPKASSIGNNKYPFAKSFDEVMADVNIWVTTFRGELANLKNHTYIPDVFKEQPITRELEEPHFGSQLEPPHFTSHPSNKPESGVKDKSVLELKPDAYRIYYADPETFGCKLGIQRHLCCGNCEMCTSRKIAELDARMSTQSSRFSCDEEDKSKKGSKPAPQRIKGSKPIDEEDE